MRIKPAFVGICGSDLHYCFDGANGDIVVTEPLVPGHEVVALVDEDPEGEYPTGTPVVVHPAVFGSPTPGLEGREHLWPRGSYLGSASTTPHTQGGMSEAMLVHRHQLRPIPADLPLERAALAEPLSVGLHALNRAGDVSGKHLLVYGAGAIGLLAARAAIVRGAEVTVADLLDPALDRARRVGIENIVNTGRDDIAPASFDIVLECTGAAPCVTAALAAVRAGGTVVQVGNLANRPIEVNLAAMTGREISYLGTLRFNDEIDEAVEMLIGEPEFAEVVTHIFGWERAVEAFGTARDAALSGKVLLRMQE